VVYLVETRGNKTIESVLIIRYSHPIMHNQSRIKFVILIIIHGLD